MKKEYKGIIQHYESCFSHHGDNHKGMDWPNEEEAILRYKIMLEVIRDKDKVSLLDFGCGTSHLYHYILLNNILGDLVYSGLDMSDIFINISKGKYPNNTYYCLDILEQSELLPSFDYIVANGVFTEKREMLFDEMWEYVAKMLFAIFKKAEKGIAFNVMSKAVDWERWDLFHLPVDLLISFMTKKLSRNFIIRNDYGLYEYTVYLYK